MPGIAGDGPVVTQICNYIASPSPAEPRQGLRPKSCTHVCTKTHRLTQTTGLYSGARSCLAWIGSSARTKCVCPHSAQLTGFFFTKSCHSEMSISSSLLSPPSWPNADLTSCRLWKHTSQRELNTQRCLTGEIPLHTSQSSASCVTRDLRFQQNTKVPNKASENG